jgi:hypothetical protein
LNVFYYKSNGISIDKIYFIKEVACPLHSSPAGKKSGRRGSDKANTDNMI